MRELWQPGWTEFDGRFYQAPRLEMQPTPPPIPVYVGGLSDIALRRAARYDGWIGDFIKTDRAIESVRRLRELRAENGLSMHDFTVLTPLTDAFTIADYQRAEAGGITGVITMPWVFYAGPRCHAGRKDRRHAALSQGPGARQMTRGRHTAPMPFTVVFANGEARDYSASDSFEISDAGVLTIQMKREDISRHILAPGAWLEVVEMAAGQPVKMTRGIIAATAPSSYGRARWFRCDWRSRAASQSYRSCS